MSWIDYILGLFSRPASKPQELPRLFDLSVVYPSDKTGEYQDLEGPVVGIESDDDIGHFVTVQTIKGVFRGWIHPDITGPMPQVGYRATIRLYRSGGGWYPEDKIISWFGLG